MSLLVWIPMVHGNCKDQGLLGVETSVVNTVTYVDGKLGKAAQIGNGNQVTNGISINTNLVEELGAQYSCSVWVKPLGNHVHYEGAIISSGDWNKKCWAFGVNQDNSKVDIFCGGYNRNVTCSVPINQWTHLVSVNNGTYVNLYKNGELVSTTTASSWPLDSDATNTTIGRETYAGGYFSFNGCIQDLRIYDHALSPLEVKHLAQGLVLHYPLNRGGFGGDNLLKVNCCSGGARAIFLENGKRVKINWTSNLGDTYWYLGLASGVILTEGETYTLSFQCSGIGNNPVSFRWCNLAGYEVFLKNGLNTYTFSMPSAHITNPFFDDINRDSNLSDLELWNFKLEKGLIATPWTPAPSDDLYSQMGLDNNIEYDVSGYGNNGTRVGTFSWSGDTPRYKVSTHAVGSSTTHLEGIPLPTEAKTISLWIKGNKSTNGAIFNDKISGLQIGLLNSLIYTNSAASTNGFTTTHWKNGEWNHVVAVNKYTLYINGQPETQSDGTSNYYIHTADKFWLWNRSYNNSYAWTGDLSDLRIYATALSADDVMALYKNAGYVDSDGNVYAYEMIE